MRLDNNLLAFLALVNAGLWEKETRLSQIGEIAFSEVHKMAEQQALVGLVAAGLEHDLDKTAPREIALKLVGQVMLVERQNYALNNFIIRLVDKLKIEGISALLVKGQGIAQCYERPLWRNSGDVDLILNEDDYQRGKGVLSKIASVEKPENLFDKHYSVVIKGFVVELHGTMRSMLTKRADDGIDVLQVDLFKNDRNRVWNNNGTQVLLPCPDDDVIFVFTHILKHFFNYGIGLRQICDWTRLLYTYSSVIDMSLLETRLRDMGLMTEWKVFGSLAVNRLGMPAESMPFYSPSKVWKRKADRVLSFVVKTGNFGRNRENSYRQNTNAIVQGIRSFWIHTCDSITHSFIFPLDSLTIWIRVLFSGLSDAIKGK